MVKSIFKSLHIITIAFLMLFTSCVNILQDSPKLPDTVTTKGEIPSGMGLLTIDLAEADSRTLLPQIPVFSKYALKFQYLNGGVSEINETVESLPYTRELVPGNWQITVTGYVYITGVEGILDGDYPCATGETYVLIEAGLSIPVAVDLFKANTGKKGVFEYDIGLPSGNIAEAQLRILHINRQEIMSRNLLENAYSTIALDEGYYLVQVRVVTGRIRSKTELMHIYSGHTTLATGNAWNFDLEGVYLSLSELSDFLDSVPLNTADNPYQVKLITNWSTLSVPGEFLGQLYSVLDGRYIGLDISESTDVDTIIESYSFSSDRDKLVSVILPEGLNQIGNKAFYGCSALNSITLPASIESINANAFAGCNNVLFNVKENGIFSVDESGKILIINNTIVVWPSASGDIAIPDGITSINSGVLVDNDVTGIIFPSSFKNDSDFSSIFMELPSLQLADFSSCTQISNLVLENMAFLSTVKLPESLASITVNNCLSLNNFIVQENGNFSVMGDGAILTDKNSTIISYPSAVGNIIIPNGIVAIGDNAFVNNTAITGITIPASLTNITARCIIGCVNLKNFNTSASSTFIAKNSGAILSTVDGTLVAWPSASGKITIPAGITAIGNNAFYQNTAITEVNFTDSSILLNIGIGAFSGCNALVRVYLVDCMMPPELIVASGSPIDQFDGTSDNFVIIVPTDAADAYTTAWAKYAGKMWWDITGVLMVNILSDAAGNELIQGTLRYALTNAQDGDIIRFFGVTPGKSVISLNSALPQITKSITIEGNGVTLTRSASWTTIDETTQLLYIYSASAAVNISRIHFKDGRGSNYGGALRNNANLTLESCIFSNNSSSYGGAIYNGGTINLYGCTFLKNNSVYGTYGSAIRNNGFLTLTGNLFFENSAVTSQGSLVYGGTKTSGGYNVVDVELGTENNQSGWLAANGDKTVYNLSFSAKSFRVFSGSEIENIIAILPDGYPTVDFYGNPIENGATAGAVQAVINGNYLDLDMNDVALSMVNIFPASDEDGMYPSSVTLTFNPKTGYGLHKLLVDGNNAGNNNSLTISLNKYNKLQVILEIIVSNASDDAGSADIPGTLRYAITNAIDGDVIRFYLADHNKTVALSDALPQITQNITIEGNGSALTRSESWTTVDDNSQLLRIKTSAVIKISRIHLKNNLATTYGGAIYNEGNLTLESCIFSGNRTTNSGNAWGGVIYNCRTLKINACTFYNNSSGSNNTGYGGVIYNYSSSGYISLTGNLFYGNTSAANRGPVVYRDYNTITISGGYNVVDVELGTENNQCGWNVSEGDITMNGLSFSTTTFKPISGRVSVIPALPEDYPTIDFYGNPITNGAAAGAVQGMLIGNYIDLAMNDTARSMVNILPVPDEDGLYPNTVTMTVNPIPNYELLYWLINGNKSGNEIQKTINLNGYTKVQAVFAINVSSNSDQIYSEYMSGTLRYALTNALDGDVIKFMLESPNNIIILTNSLPEITRSIIIEGNGATLTRSTSWTTVNDTTQLLRKYNGNGSLIIRRLQFKDGKATRYGGAIYNRLGNMTLESCVFSGNSVTGILYEGGAIYNNGTLDVKGCTFYDSRNTLENTSTIIYNYSNCYLNITGNIFYGISGYRRAVYNFSGSITTSGGYNIVDVEIRPQSGYSGWTAATGDKTVGELSFSPTTFKLIPGSAALNVIPTLPTGYPTVDFYGNPITNGAAAGAVQSME